ncbi:MAG: hypothetical protein OXR66_05840 [Candidatus Woesearchaeota archaeon]|nr:hypothetical protein [Candidatus Woesearchaeota archaeon]
MRGQAALEYLVTYGWGFLAILIVIAGLSYFGFLSPSKYLPERCDFGIQLSCADFLLQDATASADGQVSIRFRNNFGDAINITDAWLPDGSKPAFESGSWPDEGVYIAKGNISMPFRLDLPDSAGDEYLLVEGTRGKVLLTLEFQRNLAGAPPHNVSGEIFATVRA